MRVALGVFCLSRVCHSALGWTRCRGKDLGLQCAILIMVYADGEVWVKMQEADSESQGVNANVASNPVVFMSTGTREVKVYDDATIGAHPTALCPPNHYVLLLPLPHEAKPPSPPFRMMNFQVLCSKGHAVVSIWRDRSQRRF